MRACGLLKCLQNSSPPNPAPNTTPCGPSLPFIPIILCELCPNAMAASGKCRRVFPPSPRAGMGKATCFTMNKHKRELVTVATFDRKADAQELISWLEHEHLPAEIQDERRLQKYWFLAE